MEIMNERIKEIAAQAKFMAEETINKKISKNAELDAFAEKFAELIVRECSKVIVNGGYRNPVLGEKHSLTPPEIATMIEEHFGVEE